MATWIVEGTDHSTGNVRALRVNAENEAQAQAIAYQNGLTAQRVYPEGPQSQPSPMDQLGQAAHDRSAVKRPSPQASRGRDRELSSAGARLRTADTVLSIIGWLYIVLAACALLLAIYTMLNSTSKGGALSAFAAGTTVVYSIGLAFAGALFLGLGAAMRMLALVGEGIRDLNRR